MNKSIALRVDVDFEIGLVRGVPYLLDLFDSKGIRATFYVTMGPDGFSKSKNRLKSKGYLKRILNFRPWNILRSFGITYLAKQFLGLGGAVGADHPKILHSIIERGHELGVHGYDHYWWAENVFQDDGHGVAKDFENGFQSLQNALGTKVDSHTVWASPNWRCSSQSLSLIEARSAPYGADTRGTTPFFPKLGESQSRVFQIPITLPCLHEIKNYLEDPTRDAIVGEFLKHIGNPYDVWCVHDYYEGLLERDLFKETLEQVLARGISIVSMKGMATKIQQSLTSIPSLELTTMRLPGGRGVVSTHVAP